MALMDLARAIEARDPYSSGHAARVTAIAEVVAARLGWDEDQIDVLRIGAALHDIGKRAVPDTRAPQARAAQRRRARACPRPPARRVRAWSSSSEVASSRAVRPPSPRALGRRRLPDAAERATDIPIEARVLAVADAFDAMTSDRPYRPRADQSTWPRRAGAVRGHAVRPRRGGGLRRGLAAGRVRDALRHPRRRLLSDIRVRSYFSFASQVFDPRIQPPPFPTSPTAITRPDFWRRTMTRAFPAPSVSVISTRPVWRQPNFRPNAQPSLTRVTGPRPGQRGLLERRFHHRALRRRARELRGRPAVDVEASRQLAAEAPDDDHRPLLGYADVPQPAEVPAPVAIADELDVERPPHLGAGVPWSSRQSLRCRLRPESTAATKVAASSFLRAPPRPPA